MEKPEYDGSYRAAERDVIAWLLTQSPAGICHDLAMLVKVGDHRGCAPKLDRDWEIQVTLRSGAIHFMEQIRTLVRALGGYLCASDAGRLVVVPVDVPVQELQKALRGINNFSSVGVAVKGKDLGLDEERDPLFHIMLHGMTLCGYPTGFPSEWPSGRWIGVDQPLVGLRVCEACKAARSEEKADG